MNYQDAIRSTLEFLRKRKLDYIFTFKRHDLEGREWKLDLTRYLHWFGRRKFYRLTLKRDNPAHLEVLRDLAWFCRANETCAVPGSHDKTMILEGRREVFLRIVQHLHLTPEQMFELYAARPPQKENGT